MLVLLLTEGKLARLRRIPKLQAAVNGTNNHAALIEPGGNSAATNRSTVSIRAEVLSDLSIKSRTPASSATFLMCGSAKVVYITIGTAGISRLRMRVASMPFITGIERSITIRSGLSFCALSIASEPFAASPQTVQSGFSSNNAHKLRLISGLSSTTKIRFTCSRFGVKQF